MADITITEFNPIFDDTQVPFTLLTVPAGEVLTKADVVRYDGSTGKATGANATSPTEARPIGMVVKATILNSIANVFRGLAYCDGLDSVDYGADLWLSATDKKLCDTDPGQNEQVTVTLVGSPTGGTFTLTFGGQTTSAIAYNAAASAVQTALEALSTIGNGNVIVTGSAGGPYTVEFVNDLGRQGVGAVTGDGSSLTGTGDDEDVEIAVAQEGIQSILIARVVALWDAASSPTKLIHIL